MIKPRPEELLLRTAAALDETVLPSVTDGPARRQLQAATATLRRLAYALPRQAQVIAEDTADLERTLRAAADSLGNTPLAQMINAALAKEAGSIEDRNLALQEAAAHLHTQAPVENARAAEILNDFYRRTVDRELSLNPPGKDKTDGG